VCIPHGVGAGALVLCAVGRSFITELILFPRSIRGPGSGVDPSPQHVSCTRDDTVFLALFLGGSAPIESSIGLYQIDPGI
jgi:hypothetical protein